MTNFNKKNDSRIVSNWNGNNTESTSFRILKESSKSVLIELENKLKKSSRIDNLPFKVG